MKKGIIVLIFALVTSFTFGQEKEEGITKGDMELSFSGMVFTTVGTDYNITMGNRDAGKNSRRKRKKIPSF